MAFASAPFPAKDVISDKFGRLTKPWIDWFTSLTADVDASPSRLQQVNLTNQSASIGSTAINLGSLAAGLYRLTYYGRISQAATTSSSVTVTFQFTDGAVSCTFTGAAITGNTTATVKSESVLIRVSQGTPVTYGVTYASVGATPAKFNLDITVERVAA